MTKEKEERQGFYWSRTVCPRCHQRGHRFMDCPVEEQYIDWPLDREGKRDE
jgi:hypothetical protein